MKIKIVIILSAVVLSVIYNIYGLSDKPVPARTGAPDENNCSQCHTGHKVNEGTGRLSINFSNNQMVYEPNKVYDMIVSTSMETIPVFGFELVALQKNNNKTVGTFILTNTNTQLLSEKVNEELRSYIGHTQSGISAPQVGRNVWNFQWKSPSVFVGEIDFYASTIAADGNGNRFNDWVYTTNITIKENPNSIETTEEGNREIGTNLILKDNNLHITYHLNHAGLVNISLIDSKGNTINNIKNNMENVGYQEEVIVLPNNLSGVYFIKVEKNQKVEVRKIILH